MVLCIFMSLPDAYDQAALHTAELRVRFFAHLLYRVVTLDRIPGDVVKLRFQLFAKIIGQTGGFVVYCFITFLSLSRLKFISQVIVCSVSRQIMKDQLNPNSAGFAQPFLSSESQSFYILYA